MRAMSSSLAVRISRGFFRPVMMAGILCIAAVPTGGAAAEPEAGPAASGAPADKGNSFRGVAFGTPLAKVQSLWQLEPLSDDAPQGNPLKLFIRNDETKNIGGITLREIVYCFFEESFYAVEIFTTDGSQTEILRQAADIAFGGRPHVNKEGNSFVWLGKNASMQLNANPATGEGRALIFNNDLQARYEKFSVEAAKKAASEF